MPWRHEALMALLLSLCLLAVATGLVSPVKARQAPPAARVSVNASGSRSMARSPSTKLLGDVRSSHALTPSPPLKEVPRPDWLPAGEELPWGLLKHLHYVESLSLGEGGQAPEVPPPRPKPLMPGPDDWVVTGEEVREDEVIVLTGDLIVEPGGNLTLINCTLLMNCSSDGQYQIQVESGGIMNVLEGSNITAYNPEYEFLLYVYGQLNMRDSFLSECGYEAIVYRPGLQLKTEEGVVIENCTINNCYGSIYCDCSSNIVITNCTIDCCGIECLGSSDIVIANCTISLGGVYCYFSSNITIIGNTFIHGGVVLQGWELCHYASHTIEDNTVNSKPLYYIVNITGPYTVPSDAGQVIVVNSTHISLNSMNLSCTNAGLEIAYSEDVYVKNSIASQNTGIGVQCDYSSNITITECTMSQNSWFGIQCRCSTNITISRCQIRDNSANIGVDCRYSYNITIVDNVFVNNSLNLLGNSVEHYIHTVENNTVNNKPLYYLLNAHDCVIPCDAGSVVVVNSTNVVVENLDLVGIEFDWSINVTVYNCTAAGIDFDYITNASITSCHITKTYLGIDISDSTNISIRRCVMSDDEYGLAIFDSNATIRECVIDQNDWGIFYWCRYSQSLNITITGCTISHNRQGIECLCTHPCLLNITITRCTISQNHRGIVCFYWSSRCNVSVHYCNIYSNEEHGLYNYYYGVMVNATHCWWGSPDGPEYTDVGDPYDPEEVWGNVTYEPWLTEPIMIDVAPPSVEITAPQDGSYVGNVITIQADASDDVAVDRVEFYINGTLVFTDYDAPYECEWDTRQWADGIYVINATAYDTSGKSSYDTVTVTVDNTPPEGQILAPANGSYVRGIVPVNITGGDANLYEIGLYINDTLLATWTENGTYTYEWDTTEWLDGLYVLELVVVDRAGNEFSTTITVVADNTAPEGRVSAPEHGSYVRGVLDIVVEANDTNLDVAELYINSSLVAAWHTSGSHAYTWNTTAWPDGTHIIRLEVEDLAGNLRIVEITVVVDNTAPVIESVSQSPEEPVEGQEVTVEARVSDATSGVVKVILWYRVDGGAWASVEMSYSGDVWIAVIPGQKGGSMVEYYVEVYDRAGNTAKSDMRSYTVTTPKILGLEAWQFTAIMGGAAAAGIGAAAFYVIRRRRI